MKTTHIWLSALLLLAMGWSSASAQVCVEINEKRDSLSASEQKAAIALMENGFRKAGESIVDAPCEQTFQLSNARLGRTITATIKGPNGARTFQVQRIEDLGAALEQMAHSMVTGSQLGVNSNNSISRHNVMQQQISPNRVENDALAFIAIGPGLIIGADAAEVGSTRRGASRRGRQWRARPSCGRCPRRAARRWAPGSLESDLRIFEGASSFL